jgi:hypothetical protein
MNGKSERGFILFMLIAFVQYQNAVHPLLLSLKGIECTTRSARCAVNYTVNIFHFMRRVALFFTFLLLQFVGTSLYGEFDELLTSG